MNLNFEDVLKYYHMEDSFVTEISVTCRQIKEKYLSASEQEQVELELKLMKNISAYSDYAAKMYMSSFMFSLTGNDFWYDMMLDETNSHVSGYYPWDIMYQIRSQLACALFLNPILQTVQRKTLLAKIYNNIIKEMKSTIGLKLTQIPVEERNSNLIILMTNQFIGMEHGPTKTILDRCSTLIRKHNKEAIIINTGEHLNVKDRLPLYNTSTGSYSEAFREYDSVEYNGLSIPYYQCKHDMPNANGIIEILNFIDEVRPSYIIHIGGESPTGEYCDDIVPVVSIGTVPSEIGISTTTLQVIGRKIEEKDKSVIEALNKTDSDIVVGRFTSSVPMVKEKISREELGLPDDKLICIVVGARLNAEITDEFVEMMLSVGEDVVFAFAGKFDEKYEYYSDKYDNFKNIAVNLGFSSNMMGIYSVCDVYVNPLRQGGGTSVVEAMHEGLPAVSINYGDVSLGCASEFLVNDYNAMAEKIRNYAMDKGYYNKASLIAKERAREMLDSDKAFVEIIESVEQKIL